ncbi:hypothetical protein [Saccharopolyspora shandongensis]|uniref:hypothetical protein n=1 Tax=Saccharopolyspora shandongensis TaxID=418495 RepID=UPI0033E566BD
MSSEMRVLQAIRLKGRPSGADIALAAGLDAASLGPTLRKLVRAEQCTEIGGRYKLTAAGRERLTGLLTNERSGVDQYALAEVYQRFDTHNTAFKQIVTDWQIKDGATPNDHADADYDGKIVDRLTGLHDEFRSVLAEIVGFAPRLAPYPDRFAAALAKIQAGEHSWLARPMVDSYHTVWFELHEDLIGLTGRTRADEASAGRAE